MGEMWEDGNMEETMGGRKSTEHANLIYKGYKVGGSVRGKG